ncbi:hypothetical protein A1QO_02515 [Vibrio genomosp. F10 str. ZF-129]|uniref:Uncharacterized protein n=1 Tax=Vibrio genomosp. F10 str. ZF-129 TaxID=1187848 RepID=A0A1E5BLE8_9VIBR|nr:hypothetical protein [Vibrio genomosp. F10]OEE38270.1 hypothetical protein A1QO_02515 [Vibrio genomosp. F10 str. ZF-129]
MYDFYDGDDEPRLNDHEVQSRDEADMFNAVECENGCGFWRGDILDNGQCPECGGDTHNLPDDHFDD